MNHPLDRHCPKCGAIPGQVCVGSRGHERKAFHRERGSKGNQASLNVSRFARAESPIEALMLAALAEWLDHNDITGVEVSAQVPFGPYRADIWVQDKAHTLVVECDGAMWHNNADQVAHDKRRDRYCALNGISVMRFTGSEIMRDTRGCAAQVGAWIRTRR